ncbi:MAG: hypothetical protein JO285_02615, partial [Kutzneria sp.]|nr:hypothetical protein [Kutzneria sp.]
PQMVTELTKLADDQIITLGRDLWLPVRLVSHAREEQILGPVRRGD